MCHAQTREVISLSLGPFLANGRLWSGHYLPISDAFSVILLNNLSVYFFFLWSADETIFGWISIIYTTFMTFWPVKYYDKNTFLLL